MLITLKGGRGARHKQTSPSRCGQARAPLASYRSRGVLAGTWLLRGPAAILPHLMCPLVRLTVRSCELCPSVASLRFGLSRHRIQLWSLHRKPQLYSSFGTFNFGSSLIIPTSNQPYNTLQNLLKILQVPRSLTCKSTHTVTRPRPSPKRLCFSLTDRA